MEREVGGRGSGKKKRVYKDRLSASQPKTTGLGKATGKTKCETSNKISSSQPNAVGASIVDISNDLSNELCVFCADTINTDSVKCDICEHHYHLKCCGVKADRINLSLALGSICWLVMCYLPA